MYYPPAFDSPSRALIEAHYPASHRIAVNETDALRFACNAVNVGRTILLNEISPQLCAQLESRGFSVLQVSFPNFSKPAEQRSVWFFGSVTFASANRPTAVRQLIGP